MADYDIGEAFRAIEHELIASMTRNLTKHKVEELVEGYEWAQWQAMQLEALEEYKRRNAAKFPKQFSDINSRIEQEINTSYSDAQTAQEREILKRIHSNTPAPNVPQTGAQTIQGEFFKVNDRKMNALTESVTNDMQKAEYAVLRMTNDKYRSIIFNAQVYANSGAATYEKAVDMATKDFLSAGINCIEYKDGRRVPIDAYAEMALRTANKRAYLQGEGEMRKKWGIHTVILNKRVNACPKCAPFAGRVIVDDVWSGGTAQEATEKGYLLMSECIAQGLYHPNCKDAHTTYFGGIFDEEENEEGTENEVKENESSTRELLQQFTPEEQEQNIGLYNAEQRENYCKRQVQRFERLSGFSLDPDNKREYSARKAEWKERLAEIKKTVAKLKKDVAKTSGSGIIEAKKFDPLSSENVVPTLRNDSVKWIELLTDEEIRAIKKYTKNSGDPKDDKFYARLNAMLRGDIPKTGSLVYYAGVISGAISKFELQHDIICYRNMSFNPFFEVTVGDIIQPKQFLSTSVTRKGALKSSFQVIIEAKAGSKGAYIEQLSRFPYQREFLFDNSCFYKVISVDQTSMELEVIL